MIRALYTAASGMSAQQMNLDTIANNLANSSTTGFRQTRLQFQDMIYQNLITPGAAQSQCRLRQGEWRFEGDPMCPSARSLRPRLASQRLAQQMIRSVRRQDPPSSSWSA